MPAFGDNTANDLSADKYSCKSCTRNFAAQAAIVATLLTKVSPFLRVCFIFKFIASVSWKTILLSVHVLVSEISHSGRLYVS